MWDCSVFIYPSNKCPTERKEDIGSFLRDFQARLKYLSANSPFLTPLSFIFTDTFLKYPLSGFSCVFVFVE